MFWGNWDEDGATEGWGKVGFIEKEGGGTDRLEKLQKGREGEIRVGSLHRGKEFRGKRGRRHQEYRGGAERLGGVAEVWEGDCKALWS